MQDNEQQPQPIDEQGTAFDRIHGFSSFRFLPRSLARVLVKMNLGKMLIKQIFQPVLLLIGIGQLIGWSELYVLADAWINTEKVVN